MLQQTLTHEENAAEDSSLVLVIPPFQHLHVSSSLVFSEGLELQKDVVASPLKLFLGKAEFRITIRRPLPLMHTDRLQVEVVLESVQELSKEYLLFSLVTEEKW